MKRRNFIELVSSSGCILAAGSLLPSSALAESIEKAGGPNVARARELKADVVVAGGGLGGFAAALASLRNGLTVILTEETDWIGGQISQQGVPPDEHQWIETHGAPQSYRDFRNGVRDYYRKYYPLTDEARARKNLNPGDGSVSRICHEPRVALAVMMDTLAPYMSSGKLTLLLEHKVTGADVTGDKVRALKALNRRSGNEVVLTAPYFVDATELGDLLPLTKTEFVTGTESKKETGELHAPEVGNPLNNQAFTMCYAIDYVKGENHVIDKPKEYAFWQSFVPKMTPSWSGKMLSLSYSNPRTLEPKALGFHPEGIKTEADLNLWNYRKLINKNNFQPGTYPGDITIVNWPQNDYVLGNIVGVSEKEFDKHVERAKQQSLSLLYWLQTEAPRPDGGQGWAGLRLRNDIMGTEDGLAKYPYVREARRIKALFTVLEEHVGAENRALVTGKKTGNSSADFYDSVGVGYYHIDLHPSSMGVNYVDFGSLPFQIPLGSLIPKRVENLLPANKNIGTTHITNGCYRLHPVEWSIGEAVGMLVAHSLKTNAIPRAVREDKQRLGEFQRVVRSQGVETQWPKS
ncbi:FAD-dependent oxidoreductase [Telluribacter humicola]|uniref:FAD-dependent oxidoreductase n=1 Tax=Telluribacter humicola TaxID=1720261 RepID=UPI001A95EFFA|nr:FAD-dependent oxidoreductase [Telluribacter humicola]